MARNIQEVVEHLYETLQNATQESILAQSEKEIDALIKDFSFVLKEFSSNRQNLLSNAEQLSIRKKRLEKAEELVSNIDTGKTYSNDRAAGKRVRKEYKRRVYNLRRQVKYWTDKQNDQQVENKMNQLYATSFKEMAFIIRKIEDIFRGSAIVYNVAIVDDKNLFSRVFTLEELLGPNGYIKSTGRTSIGTEQLEKFILDTDKEDKYRYLADSNAENLDKVLESLEKNMGKFDKLEDFVKSAALTGIGPETTFFSQLIRMKKARALFTGDDRYNFGRLLEIWRVYSREIQNENVIEKVFETLEYGMGENLPAWVQGDYVQVNKLSNDLMYLTNEQLKANHAKLISANNIFTESVKMNQMLQKAKSSVGTNPKLILEEIKKYFNPVDSESILTEKQKEFTIQSMQNGFIDMALEMGI